MTSTTKAACRAVALLLVFACSAAVVGGCKGEAQKEADAKARWNQPPDPNFVSDINAKRQSGSATSPAAANAPRPANP